MPDDHATPEREDRGVRLPLTGSGAGSRPGADDDSGDGPGAEPGGRPLPGAPDRPIYTPPGGPPQNNSIDRGTFAAMGEANIRAMIEDFYGRLARSEIAELFPPACSVELEAAADRSASFFVFLLGGPPLYQQRYGPPMMRARHLPFRIDERARRVWLACFAESLDHAERELGMTRPQREGFESFLIAFSAWMVNTAGEEGEPGG